MIVVIYAMQQEKRSNLQNIVSPSVQHPLRRYLLPDPHQLNQQTWKCIHSSIMFKVGLHLMKAK